MASPKKRKGKGGSHVFASKSQWRWAWATHQTWADRQSHRTQALKGGPKIAYRALPRKTSFDKATGSRLRG